VLTVDFWDLFWLMLIYIPLIMIWSTSLIDVFRRDDLRGASKAMWVLVIFLLPFVGTLIYLITRPVGVTAPEREALDAAGREFVTRYASPSTADQLRVLAELHDAGKLTDEEFGAEKRKLIGGDLAVTA
jgi:hypothetical protein